jgi:hypothetical protein
MMTHPVLRCGLLFAVLAALPLAAQVSGPRTLPGTAASPRNLRRNPCWQQAGISRAVEQQVRSMRLSLQSEVSAVCSNSSLTPEQRREKIRELRRASQERINGLMNPAQEQELHACRTARGGGGAHRGGRMHHGPCGEMLPQTGPKPGAKPENHEPEKADENEEQ